jgi:hypothetical protein
MWEKNEIREHDETGRNWKNKNLLEKCWILDIFRPYPRT